MQAKSSLESIGYCELLVSSYPITRHTRSSNNITLSFRQIFLLAVHMFQVFEHLVLEASLPPEELSGRDASLYTVKIEEKGKERVALETLNLSMKLIGISNQTLLGTFMRNRCSQRRYSFEGTLSQLQIRMFISHSLTINYSAMLLFFFFFFVLSLFFFFLAPLDVFFLDFDDDEATCCCSDADAWLIYILVSG